MSLGSDDAHLAWIASGSLGSWWAWGSLGALFSSRSCHSGGSLGSRLAGGRRLSGHAGLAALSCGALDALCPWGASRAFGTREADDTGLAHEAGGAAEPRLALGANASVGAGKAPLAARAVHAGKPRGAPVTLVSSRAGRSVEARGAHVALHARLAPLAGPAGGAWETRGAGEAFAALAVHHGAGGAGGTRRACFALRSDGPWAAFLSLGADQATPTRQALRTALAWFSCRSRSSCCAICAGGSRRSRQARGPLLSRGSGHQHRVAGNTASPRLSLGSSGPWKSRDASGADVALRADRTHNARQA